MRVQAILAEIAFDTGALQKDVDILVLFDGSRSHSLPGFQIGHVETMEISADLPRQSRAGGFVHVGDDHFRAFCGKPSRTFGADAASAASHERDLVLNPHF